MLVLKHLRRAYKLISVLCKLKLLLILRIWQLARIWHNTKSFNVLLLRTGTNYPLSAAKPRLSMAKLTMFMTLPVSSTSFLHQWHWATKTQTQSKSIKIIHKIKLLAHLCWNRCQSSPLRRKSWTLMNLRIKRTQPALVKTPLPGRNSQRHQLPMLDHSCWAKEGKRACWTN